MRISEMNWMMVEEYLKRDDRAVLASGEQISPGVLVPILPTLRDFI
jgi:hypothetical protein